MIAALLGMLGRAAGAGALGEAGELAAAASTKAEKTAAKEAMKNAKDLAGAYQNMAAAGNQAYNALTHIPAKLNEISTFWVKALSTGSDAVKALAGPMSSFVELANPAAFKQFTLAVRDMDAVIGRILLPVWNSLTRAARVMGDTYATMEKTLTPAMQIIGKSIEGVFDTLAKSLRENATTIKVLSQAFAGFVSDMAELTKILIEIAPYMNLITLPFKVYDDFFGNGGPEEKSSRGAAVRQVRIGNSAEDLARRAQEAAFSQALNGTDKKDTKSEGLLREIRNFLRDISKKLGIGGPEGHAGAGLGALAVENFNPITKAAADVARILSRLGLK